MVAIKCPWCGYINRESIDDIGHDMCDPDAWLTWCIRCYKWFIAEVKISVEQVLKADECVVCEEIYPIKQLVNNRCKQHRLVVVEAEPRDEW